jgi:hypothetical protein
VLSADNTSWSPSAIFQVTKPRNVSFCNVAQPASLVSAVVSPTWRDITEAVGFHNVHKKEFYVRLISLRRWRVPGLLKLSRFHAFHTFDRSPGLVRSRVIRRGVVCRAHVFCQVVAYFWVGVQPTNLSWTPVVRCQGVSFCLVTARPNQHIWHACGALLARCVFGFRGRGRFSLIDETSTLSLSLRCFNCRRSL